MFRRLFKLLSLQNAIIILIEINVIFHYALIILTRQILDSKFPFQKFKTSNKVEKL